MKLILVAGARPNFMKIAPIYYEIARHNATLSPLDSEAHLMGKPNSPIDLVLVHTGQHYDYEMDKVFFEDLSLPEPDLYLGVGSGTHAEQTGKIMLEFEKVLAREEPDLVVVVGDVNSTLACTLAAAKFRCTRFSNPRRLRPLIAHVEAGLRSFDERMPEEINRRLTDHLSDILFTTCEDANENLRKEGIPEDRIFFVGNVMIDCLLQYKEKAQRSKVLEKLGLVQDQASTIPSTPLGASPDPVPYSLLTLHRPENVDNAENLSHIMKAIGEITDQIPVVFPIHPRTRKMLSQFPISNFHFLNVIDPVGYIDFLDLMINAKFVMTDSGGVQEETTVLGTPCLTLRQNTERPITVREGTNILVGNDPQRIVGEARNILLNGRKQGRVPPLWDGKASERILKIILTILAGYG